MTNEQRTVLLEHIKNIMTELDTRHAREMGELVSRHQSERRRKESEMSGLSAGLNDDAQPALFVVPVVAVEPVADRPFPDEQHLYVGSRINALRGQGERPRRWRGDVVEYFYPKGGKVKKAGPDIGTIERKDGSFVGTWLTVHEAKSLYRGNN
jgi:hypothetical protein